MLHTEQHFNHTFNCLPLWLLNNCNAVSNCAIKHAFAYQSPIGTRDDLYKTLLGLKNYFNSLQQEEDQDGTQIYK